MIRRFLRPWVPDFTVGGNVSTGTSEGYWDKQALPSVLKHTLLEKYMPQFAGMTGSKSGGRRVVFLDGFAGEGRYDDGTPASAETIMMIAERQGRAKAPLAWNCYFVERAVESAATLDGVVQEYVARGVNAHCHNGDVVDVLTAVVSAAAGCPLFFFLDPCGLGIPFAQLAGLLNGQRQPTWPPTEFLLNFSLEAVRRIGGHVTSPHANEATLSRMDDTVGGPWWRAHFAEGADKDAAVDAVVNGFSAQLSAATNMHIVTVPVRRAPWHKPIYNLVFGTRAQHGLWVFGDALARSTKAWWDEAEEVEAEEDPNTLFSIASALRPDLEQVERDAVPVIAENLRQLLVANPSGFKVVADTAAVFGDYYGQVREPVIRKAVKLLNETGDTASSGVGPKPRDLFIVPPQTISATVS